MTAWNLLPTPRACESAEDARKLAAKIGSGFSLLLLFALLPLVGHGCHGDDVDHEPAAPPPVYNQR